MGGCVGQRKSAVTDTSGAKGDMEDTTHRGPGIWFRAGRKEMFS